MSSPNLGWLFYKDYFRGINYANLESNSELIKGKVETIINQSITIKNDEMLGNIHFKATTTYPGLILGSGNAHELPSIEGQAILGFHFDYTSGLPVIAGSSIKGVLRSTFKHPKYIQEYVGDEIDIAQLETEIFDNGDVFFDAVVVSNGKILGDDFLTPHGDDPLKNPVPLRFIKVLPDISFRFDFELNDGILSKSKKSDLFQNILSDLGLGAKTNVGYGKFENFKKEQTQEEKALEQEQREEERFSEAIKEDSLEKLEDFKRDFPHSTRDVVQAIENIKHNLKIADIKKAFENLVKSNKKHVESFINKYKDNPDAQTFIDQLTQEGGEDEAAQDFSTLISEVYKYKALEGVIKKYIAHSILDEEDKNLLEKHIDTKMTEKVKRKKFPFGTFGNDKCLGKERANALADTLELK